MGFREAAESCVHALSRTGSEQERHELLLEAQVYALLDLADAVREQKQNPTAGPELPQGVVFS